VMCEETEKLIHVAGEVGKEVGVAVAHTATGGGSDGNFLSPLRVPILDGLGPVGGKFHTDEEYLEISSLVPRTALLSGIIERLARAG
jgi:glutamate carboxypeptidase